MKHLLCSLGLVLSLASPALLAGAEEPIFNGKDLTGWKVVTGVAPYEVIDGMIVGTTKAAPSGTPNSFLATEKEYGDFIFEYEVRQEGGPSNSGVQIRSHSRPDYRDGRVHGIQVEIDPSERAWTGGLYDEQRRLWLYPVTLNPAAKSAYKPGEWNKFRIEAIGPSIRTWVNDVPVSHLIDDMDKSGFIALQVHHIGNEADSGRKIMWRNLRLQTRNLKPAKSAAIFVRNLLPNQLVEAEKAQGWRMLWDAKSSAGWRSARGPEFPASGWEMKDGVLSVLESGGAESRAGGDIITKGKFASFELQADFRITEGANSGIKYFVQPDLNQAAGSAIGLEYQILDNEKHPDAKLGRDGNRTAASLYDLKTAEVPNPAKVKPGEWSHARIVVQGNHVEHWLNGYKVLEYERGSPEFRELVAKSKYTVWPNFGEWKDGHILLQDHGNAVSFRSIKIRELKAK